MKSWKISIFVNISGPTASGRRGRFIVLGSSGECLPVNRVVAKRQMFAQSSTNRTESNSVYSSCYSSEDNDSSGDIDDETYFSAKTSFDDFVEGMRIFDAHKYLLFSSIQINRELNVSTNTIIFSNFSVERWRSREALQCNLHPW